MVRNLTICIALAGLIAWLMMPSLVTPKSHTQRMSRFHNLQTLTLAILKYEEHNGVFPRATDDNNGLLSWRVQILPFIGEQNLYDQIDKTVAWDHPNNVPFHNQMPDVFRDPATDTLSQTSYRVISGIGTGWTDVGPPISFAAIKDGSSNCIAIISVPKNEINWLNPKTLTVQYANEKISFQNRGHCYSMFDGSTHDDEPDTELAGSPFLIADAG
jgi:hypothetical protein